MEDSCEYIEQALADSRQGVAIHLCGLAEHTIPFRKNSAYYES
jgi:hypothetical protein